MEYEASMHDVLERLLNDESAKATELPLSLLRAITNDFADAQRIGFDGFSVVYKGVLPSGRVAVEKVPLLAQTTKGVLQNDVDCLMRMRAKHKNIVRFLGYCVHVDAQWRMAEYEAEYEGKFVPRLLCFEYPSGGTLDAHITGRRIVSCDTQ